MRRVQSGSCVAALAMLLASGGVVRAQEAREPDGTTVEASTSLAVTWRESRRIEVGRLTVRRETAWVDGLRVEGEERIARRVGDGAWEVLVEPATERWSVDLARLAEGDAERLARHAVASWRRASREEVLRRDEASSRLVRAVAFDVDGASLDAAWRVLVDARGHVDVEARVHAVEGDVFARNPLLDDGQTTRVELATPLVSTTLASERFDVASCAPSGGSCSATRHALGDADGNFLFAPDAASFDDAFAEVNAYYHLHRMAERVEDELGFRWSCALGGAMPVYANAVRTEGVPYANAGYVAPSAVRCSYLFLGQGDGVDFAYDADVLTHEFGHAITDQTGGLVGFVIDGLGGSFEPGAVNEGTSDAWAASMQGDAIIGESVGDLEGAGRRDLGHAWRCPDDLVGEPHLDGRLWGGVFWTLRARLDARRADALLYATVASLPRNPSLAAAAVFAQSTAEALVLAGELQPGDDAIVTDLLAERGLFDCVRVVPLVPGLSVPGAPRRGYAGVASLTGTRDRGLAPVRYSLALPAGTRSVTLRLASWEGSTPEPRVLHLRRAEPVTVVDGAIVSDAAFELGTDGEVTLDATWTTPCTTLHLGVESTAYGSLPEYFVIAAEVERFGGARCGEAGDVDATEDAGLRGARIEGGGCACAARAPVASERAGAGLVALVIAFVIRRRQRASTRASASA